MNCYTQVTAREVIPGVHTVQFEKIRDGLEGTYLQAVHMNVEPDGYGELYLYGEENIDEEELKASDAIILIGTALRNAGVEYVELSMAFWGEKARPNTAGGDHVRIYSDGAFITSKVVWPKYAPKRPRAKKWKSSVALPMKSVRRKRK